MVERITGAKMLPATRVCKGCRRELPNNEDHFYRNTSYTEAVVLRNKCKRCYSDAQNARKRGDTAALRSVRASGAAFVPRVVGEGGPTGGYTEFPTDGYRFVNLPDTHGDKCDWHAIEAALAFVRWYRPQVVHCLGDHVDLEQFSRFEKDPDRILRVGDDLDACKKFLRLLRESAPDARLVYLKGNHEDRLRRFLWNPAVSALMKVQGMDIPHLLGFADHGVEWVESGTHVVNERLIMRHGRLVRKKAGYTATAEMERNGVSGASGHTHRFGCVSHRSRAGEHVWWESGCLCQLDPAYMEGDIADWQHGLTFGSASLTSNRFALHGSRILDGRVLLADREIGP